MTSTRVTGRVKWFNNKAGYGFITLMGQDNTSSDVFVHHSSISLDDQYRYLVQGEYVEFALVPTEAGSAHQFQAGEVKGINGGMLMCETRRQFRMSRPRTNGSAPVDSSQDNAIESTPRPPRSVSVRGSGPREGGVSVPVKENDATSAPPAKKRGRPARGSQPK
jgi:cold shock CspA family protein